MQLRSTREKIHRIGTVEVVVDGQFCEYILALRPFRPEEGFKSRNRAEQIRVHPSKVISED